MFTRFELLIFDLLVLGPALVASLGRSTFFLDRWQRAWPAALLTALPFLAWLLLATGSGWLRFAEQRSFAGGILAPLGLPPDAMLLVVAVGFASVVCWWALFARSETTPRKALITMHLPLLALASAGVVGLARGGLPHAQLTLIALGLLSPLDLSLRTKLIQRPRFWAFLATIAVFALVFGGALVQRGVFEHPPGAALGFALIGVPIEELGFVVALAGATVMVFERFELRAAAHPRKGLIARWIERRLGGYRQQLRPVDQSLPEALGAPRRVAVIGAGLAGMGAATKLAERGFSVVLLERNDYLGGKLGAWKTTMPDGREIGMNHGFHAFFHQYYNLNELFSQLGIDRSFRNIGDYRILAADGRSYSFKDIATTPVLNLLSLARHGIYSFWEVAGRHTGPKMEAFLRYDSDRTFAEWDQVSYAQFAEDARLPDSLKLVFNTFSRAFFSDADKMSMAELIKAFHFYYLSNDAGLIYEHLDDDFEAALLTPLREYMERHGVEIRTGCAIDGVRYADQRFEIDGEDFDYLVVASDVVGTRAIFADSPSLAAAAPDTAAKVATLRPGQRYSVLRLWLDRDIERELPGFVITEREQLLDAVSFVHAIERESEQWAAERTAAKLGASVIELHCYAIPEDFPDDEPAVRAALIAELHRFFPELVDAEIIHECMYVRRDFPAFHVGNHATRPSGDTDLARLFLAGDWVSLPFPAMLMEAAYSSGLLAANGICRAEALREEPVWTVPLRGLMTGRR